MSRTRLSEYARRASGIAAVGAMLALSLVPQAVAAPVFALHGAGIRAADTQSWDDLELAQSVGPCQDGESGSGDYGFLMPSDGGTGAVIAEAAMHSGGPESYDGLVQFPGVTGEAAPALSAVLKAQQGIEQNFRLFLAGCNDFPGSRPTLTSTTRIEQRISRINNVCDDVLIEFRLYCLANQYAALAQQLPDGGQYHEMKKIMKDTADKLRALADANLDTTVEPVPVAPVSRDAPAIARQRVPAVRKDNLDETMAAATVILEGASLLLIRSVEESEARYASYQTVATGIDDGMLLLRS